MSSWQIQDAKARFSELLDAAIENGPQVVTRRGIEIAVLVPIQQ
jgi:antitoxin Phd